MGTNGTVWGPGEVGPAGPQGETGPAGAAGPTGADGPTGATASQGPQGTRGDTGTAGADGAIGATGATGAAGQSSQIYRGSGAPDDGSLGVDGDYYIDEDTDLLYGPKGSGTWTLSPPISIKGDGLEALLVDYSVQGQLVSWINNVIISLDDGNIAQPTLTGNVTGVTINDWSVAGTESKLILYIEQGATAYSVTGWPIAVKWMGGLAPVLSIVTGEIDILVLTTIDNGTTIIGAHVGVAS